MLKWFKYLSDDTKTASDNPEEEGEGGGAEEYDSLLKSRYIGTESLSDFEYYVRPPRSQRAAVQRAQPQQLQQVHVNDMVVIEIQQVQETVEEEGVDSMVVIEDEKEGEQQQDVRSVTVDIQDDTCPLCGGYLPFGPQCFPCVLLVDNNSQNVKTDTNDEMKVETV